MTPLTRQDILAHQEHVPWPVLHQVEWALTTLNGSAVAPANVIASFQHYMGEEGTTVPREEYLQHLRACLADPGFCSDMDALLRTGLNYHAQVAGDTVRKELLALLPT